MGEYKFKIDGPIFNEGIPLNIAISSLYEFQAIIDKTFLVVTNRKKLSPYDRKTFQLIAQKIERGSLTTDFDIVLRSVQQLALPIIGIIGPKEIWELSKEAFDFLKLIFSASREGETVKYDFSNNKGQMNVHVGDEVYNFNGPTYFIGEQALPHYRKLAHSIEKNEITSISAGKGIEKDIALSSNDKELFDSPKVIDSEPKEINCEIFDFNKFKNNGKLSVKENQSIPPGEYNFTIIGNQDNVSYIQSMLKPRIKIECLIENIINPFGEVKIFRIHVIGVKN